MRDEFGKRSIEIVQRYNWRDVAKRTLDVYENLVAEWGSKGGLGVAKSLRQAPWVTRTALFFR